MCDPDFCIYTKGPNEVSKASRTNLRSAGFHIHIGYPENNIDTSLDMLRYIDAVVGIPSILFDTDVDRRNLYGKAGCFRLQPYGFEYRTLSSYWLGNESRLKFIWRQVEHALEMYENYCPIPAGETTRDVINSNNTETAIMLIKKFNLLNPNNQKPE